MSFYVSDHLVCRFGWNCMELHPNMNTIQSPHTETYTIYRIDTIDSPDNEHMAVRNMYRIEINIYEK